MSDWGVSFDRAAAVALRKCSLSRIGVATGVELAPIDGDSASVLALDFASAGAEERPSKDSQAPTAIARTTTVSIKKSDLRDVRIIPLSKNGDGGS